MTVEETYEAFDAYLNGTIDDATRRDLERFLKENTALRKEFELYRDARQAVTARVQWESSAQPFLETLGELSKKHFKSGKTGGAVLISMPHRRLMLRLVSVAAVLLLLILIWQPWERDLYTRYAHHPMAEFTDRSTSRILTDGAQAFNMKDYTPALTAFTQYLVEHPEDIEVHLYQAICYLELGREEEAKQIFRDLYRGPPVFQDTGAWYLGLTFLKQEQPDSARWYLNTIREGSEYWERARKVVRKM
jgi:tetratricopeptide (TPR) repeat protein